MKKGNINKILIAVFIVVLLLALVILYKFVIGFKLNIENKIKDISKSSIFIVTHDDNRVQITEKEDIEKIIQSLNDTRVKYSINPGKWWIGGAYSLIILDNETNKEIKVSIHPVQMVVNGTRYIINEEYENITYSDIDKIIQKYVTDTKKLKSFAYTKNP